MLTKVLIPHKVGREIFERLELMGITATHLYDSHEGAALDVHTITDEKLAAHGACCRETTKPSQSPYPAFHIAASSLVPIARSVLSVEKKNTLRVEVFFVCTKLSCLFGLMITGIVMIQCRGRKLRVREERATETKIDRLSSS